MIHCKRLLTSYPKLITDGNSDMHINEIELKSGFAPFLSNSWILKMNLFVILRKAFIYFYCEMLQMKITSLYGAIQLVRTHRRGKGSSIRMRRGSGLRIDFSAYILIERRLKGYKLWRIAHLKANHSLLLQYKNVNI